MCLRLRLARFQPHGVSRLRVAQTGERLLLPRNVSLARRQLLDGACRRLTALLLALVQLGEAAVDLAERRLRRHLTDPPIGNLERHRRRVGGQPLHPTGNLLAAAGELLHLVGEGERRVLRCRHTGARLLDGGAMTRLLLVQRGAARLRLGDVALQALDVFAAMEQVALEHGAFAVTAHRLFLQRGGGTAALVHLHRELLGRGGKLLHLFFQLTDRRARVLILRARQFKFGIQPTQRLPRPLDLQQPKADLQPFLLAGQLQKPLRLFGLLRQRPDPLLQLLQDVPQAQKVVLGGGQAALRLVFAEAVFGDARRFFKDLPALLGTGSHNVADAPLSHDGIAVPAKAGVHEQKLNIPQTHRCVIQHVFAVTRAIIAPGDAHVVAVEIEDAGGVIDHERHLGEAHAAPIGRAAENNILHLRPAQALVRLFAQHPADGVADVGFAAAVRPDNGGDALSEGEHRPIGKRLEPVDFQRL